MVIVKYKAVGSSEWVRESFCTPQMYMAWRESMRKKLVDVRPIRNVRRGVRV